jgi:hypothetical protein
VRQLGGDCRFAALTVGREAAFGGLHELASARTVSICETVRYRFRVITPSEPPEPQGDAQSRPLLPQPSPEFRRHAWTLFQRMIDPLAPPKPLPRSKYPSHRLTGAGKRRR